MPSPIGAVTITSARHRCPLCSNSNSNFSNRVCSSFLRAKISLSFADKAATASVPRREKNAPANFPATNSPALMPRTAMGSSAFLTSSCGGFPNSAAIDATGSSNSGRAEGSVNRQQEAVGRQFSGSDGPITDERRKGALLKQLYLHLERVFALFENHYVRCKDSPQWGALRIVVEDEREIGRT